MYGFSKLPTISAIALASLAVFALPSLAEPRSGKNFSDRGSVGDRGNQDRGAKANNDRGGQDRAERYGSDKKGTITVQKKGDDRRWRTGRDRAHVMSGKRHMWAPGISFYFSDGYYYGECGWLKTRAMRNNSPIWWDRYRRCRDWS